MDILLVCAVFALICALLVWRFHKNGWETRRLILLGLFLLSLLGAWVAKRFVPAAGTAQPIPLYKLMHISEFGYQSLLTDLISFALPFLPVGILLSMAFPGVGVGIALLTGLAASLLFALPRYAAGVPFVADELVYAALGAGTGSGLFTILLAICKKQAWLGKLGFSVPSRKRFWSGLVICLIVYFGIAFTMIADYGTTYGELQLYRGSTPLPETIEVQTELESELKKVPIYAASEKDQVLLAGEIAKAFGMEGNFSEVDGKYVIASADGGMFTYTPGNGWNYEFSMPAIGDVPDTEESEEIAREYFAARGIEGMELGKTVDTIVKDSTQLIGAYNEESGLSKEVYDALLEEAKKPIGTDLYFRTKLNGHTLIGDGEVMISVRAGGTVTRLRKTGPELSEAAKVSVIRPAEAWEAFLAGEGSHTLYEEIASAAVTDFELAYMLESAQGYYLPVWCFHLTGTRADNSTMNFECYGPAAK
ncbi:MAG: hypothetical protein IJP37_02660 [Clostridia bacterium]|nr:hypothetical protein [Clostridia bacterium]